ncbi:MAG: hypothetical protein HFI16_06400 [Lachnospiraceae bacterium]|nr:hypothetical protein [Lachnospiraceae bacterium]
MYDELNKYLSGYFTIDYWYDEGVDIAREIISEFKESDWKMLLEEISKKDVEWKKRIAYCLYNYDNKYEWLLLVELLNTEEDDELLVISLDSLRSFINMETTEFLTSNPAVFCKIKRLYYNSGRPIQIVLKDLIEKVNEYMKVLEVDHMLEI